MSKRVGNNKQVLVPKLRFPEFRKSAGWEKKLLQDITPAVFDGTHQTPKYTEQGIPFYSVENIVSGNRKKFISKEDHEAATKVNKPQTNDVLITRIGTIGFSAVVTWSFDFSIYVTLAVVKKSKKFNSRYLHGFLQSPKYQTEIRKKSLLNAVPCKINMDELRKTEILLPTLDEQQKIADCLSSLDALIVAHAEKLDALKTHKKGLMQQLFPRDGETVPSLRFAEFQNAGDWDEKKLSDIAEKISDGIHSTPIYDEDGQYYFVNGNNFINNRIEIRESTKKVNEAEYLRHKINLSSQTILISINGTIGNLAFFNNENIILGKSASYINLKRNENKFFVFNILQTQKIINHFEKELTGSTIKNLSLATIKNAKALFPGLSEQQKIADCLSSLDALIAAQAERVDALKTHKKGLMQQLFPAVENKVGA